MVYSAGILVYRYTTGHLEVMLAHPGGPFWAKKDDASWSIPKGIIEDGESTQEAARLEFNEETGVTICKDIDASKIQSNTFEMEWPPKSGKMQVFPENDKAQWFSIQEAKKKIFKGQFGFLEKLISLLDYIEPTAQEKPAETQMSFFD